MDTITLLKERFKTLEGAIEKDFMPEIAKELAPRLEDKIIEQLQRGQSGDGKTLPVYSSTSVGIYGKTPGPMTLEETGRFYKGITADVQSDGIEFFGKDPKSDMLMRDYGEEILDLQPQSIGEFNHDDLIEELTNFARDYTTKS